MHTDGSLTPGKHQAQSMMGFAAIFEFTPLGPSTTPIVMSGATRDTLFSSTTAEVMAILATIAVLPLDINTTICCDLQAALALIHKLQGEEDDSWRKSPLTYLVQFFILHIRSHTTALMLKWVRGHAGNKGNEAADKEANAAQKTQREGWWTLWLGALPEQPYWVCAGKSVAPYKIGGIVKHQEEAWALQHLLKRVCAANAEAAIRENDLKEMLDVLNWLAASSNGTWTRKNSWRHTNSRDSNLRGFVIGTLFGLLPVALCEWAWYPHSYPQAEWRNCPLCHTKVETQVHFFTCKASHQILGPGGTADKEEETQRREGPVAKWIKQVAKERAPSVLIPQVWQASSANAITHEMNQFSEKGRDWMSCKVADDKELKSVRWWQQVLQKIAIHKRWEHEYEECWLLHNDAQIRKEEASAVRPKKRRQLMHELRPPDVERDDGTPVYPHESAAQKRSAYSLLCTSLIDDWCCSRKSKVEGKGLWSINPRYS
ncbi:hypothetical protein IW146_007624 [Coemansia sp. RSA 922]|nr:hypothetical protein IW146_007624 [Coemansia sp. RSA 922]